MQVLLNFCCYVYTMTIAIAVKDPPDFDKPFSDKIENTSVKLK